MHKWIENVTTEMMAILEKKFHTDVFNFLEAKLYWHNLNCLLFSALNYDRLYHGKRFDPVAFEKDGLISKKLVQFEKENRQLLGDFLIRTANDTDKSIHLASFREQMLRMELSVRGGRLILQTGKNERDNAGSYYTPQELAKEVIRQALTTESAKALIGSNKPLRIADLSCGGGEFFRTAQNYLLEAHRIPLTRSCKYFWGVDIDPIALQISICALLEQAPKADWPEIISHFRLGNPLIETGNEAPPA